MLSFYVIFMTSVPLHSCQMGVTTAFLPQVSFSDPVLAPCLACQSWSETSDTHRGSIYLLDYLWAIFFFLSPEFPFSLQKCRVTQNMWARFVGEQAHKKTNMRSAAESLGILSTPGTEYNTQRQKHTVGCSSSSGSGLCRKLCQRQCAEYF